MKSVFPISQQKHILLVPKRTVELFGKKIMIILQLELLLMGPMVIVFIYSYARTTFCMSEHVMPMPDRRATKMVDLKLLLLDLCNAVGNAIP